MCGICGFINYNRRLHEGDKVIVEEMARKIIHRGPDEQNSLVFDNVALGFTRLSIIGLGNGMQPIYNEDKTLVLVCNGEIFNYIELTKLLRQRGHVFSTQSDVEVILHLYEDHGRDFLNQLNGQFAFALYDLRKNEIFCVRDQMGVIPFFYTVTDNTFIFGSEIKAILAHPAVKPEVDPVGLDQVMTFAGLISPRTMFRDIHSLENGHYITVDADGTISKKEYWDLVYPEAGAAVNEQSEKYYIDKLEEHFENSIKLRLRADVPSGFYLSGGLDSSMIAMKVGQLNKETRKDAFSIDFIDSKLSETVYQKLIAKECNAKLHLKTFQSEDISSRLQSSVYHSECPIKESYNTASHYLSGKVREEGIKVILSGEGSDELFAGYIGYRFDEMRAANVWNDETDPAEKRLRHALWGDESFFYELDFLKHNSVKKSLYADRFVKSFEEVNCINYPVVNQDRLVNRNTLNKRSYLDFKIRLTDHLLSDHGDRMAMANSVEVRYPFLDKDLVEFSTTVPSGLKLKDFTEKYIVKKMAERFVPKTVCDREKFGFVAPGSSYLLGQDIEYINDILSYSQVKRQNYFNPDYVEALKKEYSQEGFSINAPFESDVLMIVISFGILLDHFFDNKQAPAAYTRPAMEFA